MKKDIKEDGTFVVSYAAITNMSAEREAIGKVAELLATYHLSCTHSINARGQRIFYISRLPQVILNPLKIREFVAKRREQTMLIEEIKHKIMMIRDEQFLKAIQNEVTLNVYDLIMSLSSKEEELFKEQQCEIEKMVKGFIEGDLWGSC